MKENLATELKIAEADLRTIERRQIAAISEAKKSIEEFYSSEVSAATLRVYTARQNLQEYEIATADHPLLGK